MGCGDTHHMKHNKETVIYCTVMEITAQHDQSYIFIIELCAQYSK